MNPELTFGLSLNKQKSTMAWTLLKISESLEKLKKMRVLHD